MSFRVYNAYNVDALYDNLVANLRKETKLNYRSKVIVFHTDVLAFIQKRVALSNDIYAQVDLLSLEKFLLQLFKFDVREEIVTLNDLSLIIFNSLLEGKFDDVLLSYCLDNNKYNLLKTYSLARELAELQLSYQEYFSKELDSFFKQEVQDMFFKSQRKIYKLLQNLVVNKTRYITSFDLIKRFLSEKPKVDFKIHIFIPDYITPLMKEFLNQYIKVNDLYLYNVNVCYEYYGNLPNRYQKSSDDNYLLQSWAMVNKYNNQFLELYNKEEKWQMPDFNKEKSLLEQVQLECLLRINHLERSCDNSLQVTSHKTLLDEVVFVRNSINWHFNKHNDISYEKIAIFTSNLETYLPFLKRYFFEHTTLLEEYSRCQLLIELLLDIMESDFDKSLILQLLYHDLVMHKFNLAEEDLQQIKLWVDNLAIYRTEESGKFSWAFALKKLRLSQIIKQDIKQVFLAKKSLEILSFIIEKLAFFQTNIKQAGNSEKFSLVQQLCVCFIDSSNATWSQCLLVVKQSLLDLRKFVDVKNNLSLRFIKAFLIKNIVANKPKNINKFNNIIFIDSLYNIAPRQFDIIYVLGLEEGSFPPSKINNMLDLAQDKKYDNEKLLFSFMQLFMSCKKKLFLSFIAVNLKSGEEKQMGSVLLDLQYYLQKDFKLNAYINEVATLKPKENEALLTSDKKTLHTKENYNISHLISFIKNPLEYFCKYVLELDFYQETNIFDETKEPIELSFYEKTFLKKEVSLAILEGNENINKVVRDFLVGLTMKEYPLQHSNVAKTLNDISKENIQKMRDELSSFKLCYKKYNQLKIRINSSTKTFTIKDDIRYLNSSNQYEYIIVFEPIKATANLVGTLLSLIILKVYDNLVADCFYVHFQDKGKFKYNISLKQAEEYLAFLISMIENEEYDFLPSFLFIQKYFEKKEFTKEDFPFIYQQELDKKSDNLNFLNKELPLSSYEKLDKMTRIFQGVKV